MSRKKIDFKYIFILVKVIIKEIEGRWYNFLPKCKIKIITKIRNILSKMPMNVSITKISLECFILLKDFDKRVNFNASKMPKNLMDLKGILPGLRISQLNDLLMTAPCT